MVLFDSDLGKERGDGEAPSPKKPLGLILQESVGMWKVRATNATQKSERVSTGAAHEDRGFDFFGNLCSVRYYNCIFLLLLIDESP